MSDLFKIAETPDVADLVTPEGLKEHFGVISGMATDGDRSVPRRVLDAILQRLNRLCLRWVRVREFLRKRARRWLSR